MDTRSKIDIIYQDALGDVKGILDRMEAMDGIISRATDDAIEKLNVHIGHIVKAAEELDASADILVEKKLREVHDVITKVAEDSIKEALGRHVSGEVTRLKAEISQITTQLRATLAQARASQTTTAAVGAVVGAVVALVVAWGGIMSGIIPLPDNSAPVAQQTASNTKQVPRNR